MAKGLRLLFGLLASVSLVCSSLTVEACGSRRSLTAETLSTAATCTLCGTYYDTLDERDKALYRNVYAALEARMAGDTSFRPLSYDVSGDIDGFKNVLHAVLYDHPEYGPFWNRTSVQLKDGTMMRITPTGSVSDLVANEEYDELVGMLKGDTDFDTAWNLLYYFSQCVSYDKAGGEHADDDAGVWQDGKARCQGVSFAYVRSLRSAGIPAVIVTGYTSTDMLHMAVAISLGGHWYLCDPTGATGNDPEPYFCMTEENLDILFREPVYWPMVEE